MTLSLLFARIARSPVLSVPARSRRRNRVVSSPARSGKHWRRSGEKRHRQEVTIDAVTSMERQARAAIRARQGGPRGAGPPRGRGRGDRCPDRQQGARTQRGGEAGKRKRRTALDDACIGARGRALRHPPSLSPRLRPRCPRQRRARRHPDLGRTRRRPGNQPGRIAKERVGRYLRWILSLALSTSSSPLSFAASSFYFTEPAVRSVLPSRLRSLSSVRSPAASLTRPLKSFLLSMCWGSPSLLRGFVPDARREKPRSAIRPR